MAYSKTTWVNGDTITAEKLNNIENGVAENDDKKAYVIKCTENNSTYTLDKTYEEITNAIREGYAVFVLLDRTNGYDPTAYGLFLTLQTMNSGSYVFACFRLIQYTPEIVAEVNEIQIALRGEELEVQYKQTNITHSI